MCPICGAPATWRQWDNGVCDSTGYRDAGSVLDCPKCGQLMEDEVDRILLEPVTLAGKV